MSQAQGGHPAPEDLDLLLEDEAGRRSSDVALTSHVDTCPQCQDLLAGMSDVRSLLRAEADRVPEPPADLEERIAAALARAAGPGGDTAPDDGRAGEPATASRDVVPLRRRPVVPRWMAVAAGLVVLVGAAGVATQLLGDQGGPTAMLGSGDDSGGGESAALDAAAAATVVATGTDYRAEALAEQVTALAAGTEGLGTMSTLEGAEAQDGADAGAAEERAAESSGEPLATPEGLAGCLSALGVPEGSSAVVDLATWQGREAAVIVLDEGSRAAVWVVDRGCRPGADGLIHYQAVSR